MTTLRGLSMLMFLLSERQTTGRGKKKNRRKIGTSPRRKSTDLGLLAQLTPQTPVKDTLLPDERRRTSRQRTLAPRPNSASTTEMLRHREERDEDDSRAAGTLRLRRFFVFTEMGPPSPLNRITRRVLILPCLQSTPP